MTEFADAEGDVTEEDGFGKWRGVEEVGSWMFPIFLADAGFTPFCVLAVVSATIWIALEQLRRFTDRGFAGGGDDAWTVAVVALDEEVGFGAEIDVAAIGHPASCFHFGGAADTLEGGDFLAVFEQFAFVPVNGEFGAGFAVGQFTSGENPAEDGTGGEHVVAVFVDFQDFHALRCAGVHGPENAVHGVAGHVCQRTAAEVVKSAPFEIMINAIFEGAFGGGPKPEIPIDIVWNGVFPLWAGVALWPDGTVGDAMDFVHVAEEVAIDVFVDHTVAFIAMALVAHLGGNFVFFHPALELAAFPDGVHERLLRVSMFACGQGQRGGHVVVMVGGGDHDGIEIFDFLVEQLAVVLIEFGIFPSLWNFALPVLVNVTMGDDDVPGSCDAVDMSTAFAASGDYCDLEFIALILGMEDIEAKRTDRSGAEGGLEESSSVGDRIHGVLGCNGLARRKFRGGIECGVWI